ncbi:hypothetical protein GCM10010448_23510 [Streptomyces glomeratus]|uniref:Uncharacterized protein n=1 Tax=Streptomyces glomeratus TaxID=284452 RepID=A0ABP6LDL7_9ACTN
MAHAREGTAQPYLGHASQTPADEEIDPPGHATTAQGHTGNTTGHSPTADSQPAEVQPQTVQSPKVERRKSGSPGAAPGGGRAQLTAA